MTRVYELPYAPSVNHYWRRVCWRTLISREGRRYRRDLDNLQKAFLDALEHGGAFGDDSQIAKLEVERADIVPGGKVFVEIEPARAGREQT